VIADAMSALGSLSQDVCVKLGTLSDNKKDGSGLITLKPIHHGLGDGRVWPVVKRKQHGV
jgi:hypothetical protein